MLQSYNNCSCSWGGEGPDTLNAGSWPRSGARCCLLVLGWQRLSGGKDRGDNFCCNGTDCCLLLTITLLLLLLAVSGLLLLVLLLSTDSAASAIVHSCSSIGGLWCSSVDQSLEYNFR